MEPPYAEPHVRWYERDYKLAPNRLVIDTNKIAHHYSYVFEVILNNFPPESIELQITV